MVHFPKVFCTRNEKFNFVEVFFSANELKESFTIYTVPGREFDMQSTLYVLHFTNAFHRVKVRYAVV